jgi:hypothetical protein
MYDKYITAPSSILRQVRDAADVIQAEMERLMASDTVAREGETAARALADMQTTWIACYAWLETRIQV